MKRALILLSGGLDSTTTLAIAKAEGFEPYTITFRYGQRHSIEIKAAEKVSSIMEVKGHITVDMDLRQIGASALTSNIEVPKKRTPGEITRDIPVTYVPARNIIFLSFALAYAETIGASDIFIGVNVLDYSGYPDCRPEFIEAYEKMANLGTKAGVEGKRFNIHTPLIRMTKAEIIKKGLELGVDYSITHSCYDPTPEGLPCGECDSCILRKKGFAEAGMKDPLISG
ncbi:MAG: 7-cyano-7-deazaguanine synthase QueC [Deltaproteobacteria bacterium]